MSWAVFGLGSCMVFWVLVWGFNSGAEIRVEYGGANQLGTEQLAAAQVNWSFPQGLRMVAFQLPMQHFQSALQNQYRQKCAAGWGCKSR